jgi:hypothetical protein
MPRIDEHGGSAEGGLLSPRAFVWCIAGPHIGETLAGIVERKQGDIERFGWCFWAYGGMGNAHPETEVRRLANQYVPGEPLPLLMPDTGKSYPEVGQPFDAFRATRSEALNPIPAGMSPVSDQHEGDHGDERRAPRRVRHGSISSRLPRRSRCPARGLAGPT